MVVEGESTPGIATTSEVTLEELQLAARNHGMPLEGLRYDVTPVGMHYLLTHFDIPETDGAAWQLDVGGLVERPLSLGMDDLRARPAVTTAVTMECAGNGRARLEPRPLSQPWLSEAVGTAEWTGTPLRPILEEAGLEDDVADLVFTGADHGIQGDVEQDYERSLSVADATRDEVLLAYAINGSPLPPQHGYPLRLVVPGWYGMASVKWLRRITAIDRPFDGFQMGAYRMRQEADDEGVAVTRMLPRALIDPARVPRLLRAHPHAGPRTGPPRGEGVVGARPDPPGGREHRRRRHMARGHARGIPRAVRVDRVDDRVERPGRGAPAHGAGYGRGGGRPTPRAAMELPRFVEQPGATRDRDCPGAAGSMTLN